MYAETENSWLPSVLQTDEGIITDDYVQAPLTEDTLGTLGESPHAEVSPRNLSSATTAQSMRIVTFDEGEPNRKGAGEPVPGCGIIPRDGTIAPLLAQSESASMTKAEKYYPFKSATDFSFARRFWRRNLTMGTIDDLLENESEDSDAGFWHDKLSFTNSRSWRDQMFRIPYGIAGDHWQSRPFTVNTKIVDKERNTYSFRYRSVLDVVDFLLGHPPFAPNLSYAPIRLLNKDDARVYNEMHTGDWWWETQKKLPPKSTVVPLLFATDKTQLTHLHGDQSAWPVYMTIGNLDRETRRAQKRPSVILLGLIPIPRGKADASVKSDIYHTAMELMLQPIEKAAREGLLVVCADGLTRFCFPIIAGFAADYEEQVLITGIKSGRQCSICQVPPDERHRLCGRSYPLRTHEDTYKQIQRQQQIRAHTITTYARTASGQIDKSMWVHERDNFAWKHWGVNIHEVLLPDILHQIMKGIVARLMTWIQKYLSVEIGSGMSGKKSTTVQKSDWELQLDDRFRQVPAFPGLKVFQNFSSISQWTGVEQKALLQQIVPVVAPLLKDEGKMHFIRAVVDFALQAVYKSHDDTTLRYMNDALRRMDLLKWSFQKEQGQTAFNYPKFHVLTHWTDLVRKFGAADGFDTAHFEAAHIYLIKKHYQLTNKRLNFEQQILGLNIRRVKMLAMSELLQLRERQPSNPKKVVIGAMATSVARATELKGLGWVCPAVESEQLRRIRLGTGIWRHASTMAKYLQIPDFIDGLAVFVREERRRLDGIRPNNAQMERLEQDPSWVERYPVTIHSAIHCWKASPPRSTGVDNLVKETLRCSPAWQGNVGVWRRDCVWVQEFDPSKLASDRVRAPSLEGRLPGELQVVVTVLDQCRQDEHGQSLRYIGALVDVFQLRNQGRHHDVHGMIEVQRVVTDRACRPRTLGHRRFYRLDLIHRSAHLVPAGRDKPAAYYVNPYIDWEQYNSVYDREFDGKECQAALKIHRKRNWRTFND